MNNTNTNEFHTHIDERGAVVRCYHNCKVVLKDGSFWIGVTVTFPLEHLLWEKVWPFSLLTAWMGL